MSSVSRSVYQKLKEENKRLLADILVLTDPMPDEKFMPVLKRWRKHFQEQREFDQMLKEVVAEYIKEHPEFDIKQRTDGADNKNVT